MTWRAISSRPSAEAAAEAHNEAQAAMPKVSASQYLLVGLGCTKGV